MRLITPSPSHTVQSVSREDCANGETEESLEALIVLPTIGWLGLWCGIWRDVGRRVWHARCYTTVGAGSTVDSDGRAGCGGLRFIGAFPAGVESILCGSMFKNAPRVIGDILDAGGIVRIGSLDAAVVGTDGFLHVA